MDRSVLYHLLSESKIVSPQQNRINRTAGLQREYIGRGPCILAVVLFVMWTILCSSSSIMSKGKIVSPQQNRINRTAEYCKFEEAHAVFSVVLFGSLLLATRSQNGHTISSFLFVFLRSSLEGKGPPRDIQRLPTTPFSLVLRKEYFDCPQRDSQAVHYI
jgi:hypothetical protein